MDTINPLKIWKNLFNMHKSPMRLLSSTLYTLPILLLALCAPTSRVGARDVEISEFQASNTGPLVDDDGDFSDWIELRNLTTRTVNLDGWYLTDDPLEMTKWRFPEIDLPTGAYLVLFASGKDRYDPAAPLHTNFRLDAGGEYLALTRSDGETVEHAYAPAFPPQREGYSYGVGSSGESVDVLVPPSASARLLIPSDGTLGTSWTEPGFDDGAWMVGTNNAGFSDGPPLEVYFPFDETSGDSAADASGRERTATLSGTQWKSDATRGRVAEFGSGSFARAPFTQLPPTFTLSLWVNQTARTQNSLGLFQIQAGGSNTASGGKVIGGWVSSTSSPPGGIWGRVIQANGVNRNLPKTDTFLPLDTWTHLVYRSDGAKYEVFVNGEATGPSVTFDGTLSSHDTLFIGRQGGESWNGMIDDFAVWSGALSADQIAALAAGASPAGIAGFSHLIETDLSVAMRDAERPSLFMRIAFDAGDATEAERLALRLRYDDGFAAWLNGERVAGANAPEPLLWDSVATTERPSPSVGILEEFDLTPFVSQLRSEGNVLAIQGLNLTPQDDDFLIDARLEASTDRPIALAYMPEPTPGDPNSGGVLGFVADTRFSVDRGFFDAPSSLTITCATTSASIYFTTDGAPPSPENPTATLYAEPIIISRTTTLRAAAFKPGHLSSNTDTQTYIFRDQVLSQDPLNDPDAPDYPTVWQAGKSADFEMDPRVATDTTHALYQPTLRDDLLSLPTMSIVMPHEDLWGEANGIYNHATTEGDAWKRPASVEYFDPASEREFQVDCGVQMHGNASRDNVRTKKHSFRLLFKDEFGGPTWLEYPLFSDSKVEKFNTLVLRGCFTDSFPTRTGGSRYSPHDSQYLRDVWMRNAQMAMGHLSSHSEFVHLYINGLYWGLYNIAERPDDAFFETYDGGEREEYDIVKDFNQLFRGSKTDWNAMFVLANNGLSSNAAYQAIQGNDPDGQRNPALPLYLDVENLIDYMILHIFAGAEDWPHHNWYAARRRGAESTGFRFYVWDQEIALDNLSRNRINVDNDHTPAGLYARLRQNAEFRLRFADRVRRHMLDGGALSVKENRARWMGLANRVERSIVGESARWGDARESEIGKVMTLDDWLAERDELINNYFPDIHTITLQRFRAAGLYPAVEAPVINAQDIHVPLGFSLAMMNPNGQGDLHYTTDGADPRLVGGAVNTASSKIYTAPFSLNDSLTIKARVLLDGEWSALTEATFSIIGDAEALRVTELMYNPLSDAEGLFNNDDFEFIELRNIGAKTLSLSGATFAQGIQFDFPPSYLLPAGEYALVVRNAPAFASRYGAGLPVVGEYSGQLGNDGETIELRVPGFASLRVTHNDALGWPLAADGGGHSLIPRETAMDGQRSGTLAYGGNWRPSAFIHGSPGQADPTPPPAPILNELAAHTDLPELPGASNDWVEIFNPALQMVVLDSNWYLSDDVRMPKKWPIHETLLLPDGRVLFDEVRHFHNPVGFGLNKAGEQLVLSHLPGSEADRIVDAIRFGPQENGDTWGRYPDGDPFPRRLLPSPSNSNALPPVHPVLSEIHYHPEAAENYEFVEIHNPSPHPIALESGAGPWRLARAVQFSFTTGTVLSPGQRALVVPFNPDDPLERQAFQNAYGIAEALLFGPYVGSLDNRGERLTLEEPIAPDAPTDPLLWAVVDEVIYFYAAPFPEEADGQGYSLERLSGDRAGNDPATWRAALPSPGTGAEPVWSVSVEADTGDVDLEPLLPMYPDGSIVILTARPAPGYRFLRWEGDAPPGQETDNPLTLTLHGSVVLRALFRAPFPGAWIIR